MGTRRFVLSVITVFTFCLISQSRALAGTIAAVTLSVPTSNDRVDWGAFGPDDTDITSGSLVQSQGGLAVAVSEPEYGLQIRNQSGGSTSAGTFYGDFNPGTAVLTNWNSGFAVTITFERPIYGAWAQIDPAQPYSYPSPFTAYVSAYNGSSLLAQASIDGTVQNLHDGSAPYLGMMADSAEITSLVYRVSGSTNDPTIWSIGIGPLALQTASPVPEPPTLVMLTAGLFLLLWLRTSKRNSGELG